MAKLGGEAFAQLHNAINVGTSNSLEQSGITNIFGAEVTDNFAQAGNILNPSELGM